MVDNSGYFLNNYKLNKWEIGLCLITGLTGAPYAKRHWELSKINPRYALWHKAIAVAEYTPVMGGFVALIERITAFAISIFSNTSRTIVRSDGRDPLTIRTMGNATASEFISCLNPTLFSGLTPLTEKEAQDFLNRGGSLNIITDEKINSKRINISKEEQIITGCNSGINRSQVAAAIFINMRIAVKGVFAGGDSAMNPEANFPSFADPSETGEADYQSATNFKNAFGFPKLNQIGANELESFIEDERAVIAAKNFYQRYINELSPTHFITFSSSGPSVIRRLLKREGSLKGFTITYCPWGDEIAHPPAGSDSNGHSVEAYQRFAAKLRNCFTIT